MTAPPPPLSYDEPPPRHAWEEPPAGGWTSSLRGFGFAVLRFVACVAVGALDWRLVVAAHRISVRGGSGLHYVGVGAMWAITLGLAALLALYLSRRRGALALVLAMLSDHRRLIHFRARPPIWLDAPPDGALRVAHLSDLHIAESPTVRLVERVALAGNAQLATLLDSPAVRESDLVLFTGDVTDRGTADSWAAFLGAIEERGLADRVVLVPGNHDLALVEYYPVDPDRPMESLRGERAWLEKALRIDRFGIVQLANLLKFHEAFARTAGGKFGYVYARPRRRRRGGAGAAAAGAGGSEAVPYLEAWEAAEREVRAVVESLPSTPVPPLTLRGYFRERRAREAYERRIERARQRLFRLFPVAVPVAGRDAREDAVLFVLNSCTRVSRHPAGSAIGRIGHLQYRRLERLAACFPQRLRLVGVHHHLVRRGEEMAADLVSSLMARFAVLGDAWRLVHFCRTHDVRAVMNGHRHISYQVRLSSGSVLLASPSSTLGDELAGDPRPQLERYDFAPSVEGRSVGIYRTVVRPVRAPALRVVTAADGG